MTSTTPAVRKRPIIFSAESVRAILDGRKTQTRRAMSPQPFPISRDTAHVGIHAVDGDYAFPYGNEASVRISNKSTGPDNWAIDCPCPHGAVGDHLWVRETWAPSYTGLPGFPPHYRADLPDDPDAAMTANHAYGLMRWRSPIHMPRSISRITLEITDVRVQRVHSISDADVRAEGVDPIHIEKNRPFFHKNDIHGLAFGEQWNKANGKTHPWSSNPWVWALSFRPAPVRPSPAVRTAGGTP